MSTFTYQPPYYATMLKVYVDLDSGAKFIMPVKQVTQIDNSYKDPYAPPEVMLSMNHHEFADFIKQCAGYLLSPSPFSAIPEKKEPEPPKPVKKPPKTSKVEIPSGHSAIVRADGIIFVPEGAEVIFVPK